MSAGEILLDSQRMHADTSSVFHGTNQVLDGIATSCYLSVLLVPLPAAALGWETRRFGTCFCTYMHTPSCIPKLTKGNGRDTLGRKKPQGKQMRLVEEPMVPLICQSRHVGYCRGPTTQKDCGATRPQDVVGTAIITGKDPPFHQCVVHHDLLV